MSLINWGSVPGINRLSKDRSSSLLFLFIHKVRKNPDLLESEERRSVKMTEQANLIAKKQARITEVHRMLPSRTALLVIDMQRSFMDPEASLAVPTAWDILPPIKTMVE